MLDLNAFADEADFQILAAIVLEIRDLKAMEAGLELYPRLSEAASIPVQIEEKLSVKEKFGSVVRRK